MRQPTRQLGVLGLCLLGCQLEPRFTGLPPFEGTLVLFQDRLIAGGAVSVGLLLTPPDTLDFPTVALPGGNEEPGPRADLHLALDTRYTAAGVLGSALAGDFVPFLIVQARLENLDTGDRITTFLIPEASLSQGYHYGRNLRLIESLGLSEAGYLVNVQIIPPALAGDPDAVAPDASLVEQQRGRSPLSPGIVIGPDLAPFTGGTVFSVEPIPDRQFSITALAGAFTLEDFLPLGAEGSEGAGSGEVPTYTY
jgi:hypothetical protein